MKNVDTGPKKKIHTGPSQPLAVTNAPIPATVQPPK